MMNRNRSTVVCWLKSWKETEDLSDRGKTRRQQDEVIIDSVRHAIDERITSEKMQEQLLDGSIDVNACTIRRRLGKTGFKYMKPRRNLYLLNISSGNVYYGLNH